MSEKSSLTEQLIADFRRLTNEVERDLNELSSEARKDLDELETEVKGIEARVRGTSQRASALTKERAAELTGSMRSFINRHVRGGGDTHPRPLDHGYSVQLSLTSLDQAVARVTDALAARGLVVLSNTDVRALLAESLEHDFRGYRILTVTAPKLAAEALDADPYAGLVLSWTVVVQLRFGAVEVTALKPKALATIGALAGADEADEAIRATMLALDQSD